MSITHTWKIPIRAPRCCVTGREFIDGDDVITVLASPPEGETLLRFDRSANAEWQAGSHPPVFSQWRTVFVSPPPRAESTKLHPHPAESLLRQLLDDGDPSPPSHDRARYVVALMLERQRMIRQVGMDSMATGQKTLVYEHNRTGEVFLIPDPGIRLNEIERVQMEVLELMDRL